MFTLYSSLNGHPGCGLLFVIVVVFVKSGNVSRGHVAGWTSSFSPMCNQAQEWLVLFCFTCLFWECVCLFVLASYTISPSMTPFPYVSLQSLFWRLDIFSVFHNVLYTDSVSDWSPFFQPDCHPEIRSNIFKGILTYL